MTASPMLSSWRRRGVNGEPLGPAVVRYNGKLQAVPVRGTYAIQASLTASGNYTSASATATLVIRQATPQVTWPAPAPIVYGTPLGAGQLDAAASVSGTFTYTPPAGTILHAGDGQPLAAAFTPTDSVDYTGAAVTVLLDVLEATPVITWPTPEAIVYGTPLGTVQLDASASTSGALHPASPPAGRPGSG